MIAAIYARKSTEQSVSEDAVPSREPGPRLHLLEQREPGKSLL
jgi:hypothetical protein